MLDIIEIILLAGLGWLLYSQKGDGRGLSFFSKRRRLILDSCALIDGRIVEIVKAGFVADELVIPQFILNELQMLADGNDSHKRERARYGLDVAHELQDSAPMRVSIDRTVFPNIPTTDDKLVQLAKQQHAQLYTTDYNLGKVAAVEGVKVLNVNELSQSLRPITLPGETLQIKVVQKGSNRDQGVGYLDDGTMIVIEGGARFVGREMPVTVTRMHQTVAGKMVFGQIREQRRGSGASHAATQQPQSQAQTMSPAEAALLEAMEISEQPRPRSRARTTTPAPAAATAKTDRQHRRAAADAAATPAKNKLHARLNMRRRRVTS